MTATERSPLLHNGHDGREVNGVHGPRAKLGPLEISGRERRTILVGVWMATFCSVSS